MKSIKILVALSLVNIVFVTTAAKLVKPTNTQPKLTTSDNALNTGKLEENKVAPTNKPITTPTPVITTTATPTSTQTPTPTPAVTPTPTPTPTPTLIQTPPPAPTGCLVQIDGVTYDVTSLRQTHSGGDIFSCGTDMSQIFWSQHNQKILNKMQQYRI